jgi:hypothetical protein
VFSNGLAHLPPVLASQQCVKTYFSGKAPTHTYAEGGQVERVLGGICTLHLTDDTALSLEDAWAFLELLGL